MQPPSATATTPADLPAEPARRGDRLLGLAVPARRDALGLLALVALVFGLTASRDLSFYDSAELALVARQGGLGHPIGQPLHTLLGFLIGQGDATAALWRLNLLSALPAALCVVPALSLAGRWGGVAATRPVGRFVSAWVVLAGCLHAAFWEPATRVEVYALASFPALWAVARVAELVSSPDRPSGRALFLPGLALGLAASSHAHVAVFAALAVTPAAMAALGARRWPWVAVLWLGMGGLLGLAPYAWIAGAQSLAAPDAFVWGRGDVVRFLVGADYAQNREILLESPAEKLARFAAWSAEAGVVLPLVAGVLAAARRRPAGVAALAWGLAVAVNMSNTHYLPEITDYLGYVMVAQITGTAAAASLAARWTVEAGVGRRVAGWSLAGALVLNAAWAPPGVLSRTRSADVAARRLATEILENAPPGAIVLAGADHFVWPLHYLQAAEGLRPDIVVLADGLLDSSWYWAWTYAQHPDLVPVPLGGSHVERVRRFLAAQGPRGLLFEHGPLSGVAGVPICADRLFVRAPPCTPGTDLDAGATLIEALAAELGDGSPATEGALAQVAYDRGATLWTLGHGEAALRTLLAGVPAPLRPISSWDPAAVARVPPLRERPPVWRRPAPLGRPERNLYLAAWLLERAGQTPAAAEALAAAQRLGLPEADALEVAP